MPLLDVRNRIDKVEKLYKGSVSSSQVRIGEIFKAAVRSDAVNNIIVHNHPGGDTTPSPDNVALPRAIVQAGKYVDPYTIHIVMDGKPYHFDCWYMLYEHIKDGTLQIRIF